ncbi:MAG: hypothetical protein HPY44_11245 [Armatimonadetes bacterium]|nr:hypothetical protein [Armatimonadota bacterium]
MTRADAVLNRRRPVTLFGFLGVVLMVIESLSASAGPASGPLRVSPDNPRYFADPAGKVVYLTGSHTWSNLKDMGKTDPPPEFDFVGCLEMMEHYHHNFIRLWTWELSRYAYGGETTYCAGFPWPRTGPELALDGKPKFDLSRFDQSYFDRLRQRVQAAGERGIYVSIMLFEGHGLHASDVPWCWDGHPFNARNNINGIDGNPDGNERGIEIQTLALPAVVAIQEAYVRKVVETVNDLDNVLYEIANESGAYSTDWQYHFIRFIHELEKGMGKQHPVGMTFQYCRDSKQRGKNATLFESPAEWVSPNPDGGYRDNPPAADGRKVIINDTDHLWGIGGNPQWVWKSFCRGHNPIFMDPFSPPIQPVTPGAARAWTDHLTANLSLDPKWDPIRKNMGYTLRFAERMDLSKAVPHGELASSGYCLADPGAEYLIYSPNGGAVTVDLTGVTGELSGEWFNPATGEPSGTLTVPCGAKVELVAPFDGDSVLKLTR